MKNQVIEIKGDTDKIKALKYFKGLGYDIETYMQGVWYGNKWPKQRARYYGVIDGRFGRWRDTTVLENNAEIIPVPAGVIAIF